MSMNVKKLLSSASAIGLGMLLAACGPDDTTASTVTDDLSLAAATGPFDWPMDGADIGFGVSGEPPAAAVFAPLAAAAPMVRNTSGNYRYAPDWDYPEEYISDGPGYANYGSGDGYDYDSHYDPSPSSDNYGLLAMAAVLGSVIGNSPPDYYFEHRGVQPWVWMTEDRYVRYAEPISTGYRYYYYEPEEARPFLVRDPYYSYGYRGDRLAVVYDHDGRVLRSNRAMRLRSAAATYYDRGLTLHRVSGRTQRHGVAAPLWQDRRNLIFSDQRQWDNARAQSVRWQAQQRRYEQATGPRWQGERAARRYAAKRFDTWRQQDYRGAAPRVRQELVSNPQFQRAALSGPAFTARRNEGQASPHGLRREDVARYGLVQRDGQRFAAQREGLTRGTSPFARRNFENGQRLKNRNEARENAGLVTGHQKRRGQQRSALSEQRQMRSPVQLQQQQAQRRAGLLEKRQVQQRQPQQTQHRQMRSQAQQQRQAQQAQQRAGLREQRQVQQRQAQQTQQRQMRSQAQQQRQAQQAQQRAGLREQRQVQQRQAQQTQQRQMRSQAQQQRQAQQAQQRAGLREQRQVQQRQAQQTQQRQMRPQAQQQRQAQQAQQRAGLREKRQVQQRQAQQTHQRQMRPQAQQQRQVQQAQQRAGLREQRKVRQRQAQQTQQRQMRSQTQQQRQAQQAQQRAGLREKRQVQQQQRQPQQHLARNQSGQGQSGGLRRSDR